MIEVLVAASIMMVIVMMLAMLFQQTSMAWRTGVKRADTYMQIRAALGAIQRDASAAVDERTIPQELRDKLGGEHQNFSGPLQFYTLTGTGNDPAMRALTFVKYDLNGTRTEKVLRGDGSPDSKPSSSVLNFVDRKDSGKTVKIGTQLTGFIPKTGSDSKGLPLSVVVKAKVSPTGYSLEIGAGSAGPDRTWAGGKGDDIVTWVK